MDVPVELLTQCRVRCSIILARLLPGFMANNEQFSEIITHIISSHPNRIPFDDSSPRNSTVPDWHVDLIAANFIRQHQRVNNLLMGSEEHWAELAEFIEKRIKHQIRRLTSPEYDILLEQFDEISQHCAAGIWSALSRFPYDTELEAWVTRVIQYDLIKMRRLIYRERHTISLSKPLFLDQPDSPTFEESLPDQNAEIAYDLIEKYLMIHNCLDDLSADQRLLLIRLLRGEQTAEIASGLSRSPNAVYKLRERMMKSLHEMLVVGD